MSTGVGAGERAWERAHAPRPHPLRTHTRHRHTQTHTHTHTHMTQTPKLHACLSCARHRGAPTATTSQGRANERQSKSFGRTLEGRLTPAGCPSAGTGDHGNSKPRQLCTPQPAPSWGARSAPHVCRQLAAAPAAPMSNAAAAGRVVTLAIMVHHKKTRHVATRVSNSRPPKASCERVCARCARLCLARQHSCTVHGLVPCVPELMAPAIGHSSRLARHRLPFQC